MTNSATCEYMAELLDEYRTLIRTGNATVLELDSFNAAVDRALNDYEKEAL